MISKVEIEKTDGAKVEAKLPSNELKLVGKVIVEEDETSTVTVDFVADKSIHTASDGKYVFAPVILLETRSDANAEISEGNIVTIIGGNVISSVNAGMDVDGEIKINFKLNPASKIQIDSAGKIQIMAE